jgi:hypothetical protein
MPTYIEGFELDAVISEERSSECEITEHPVEKGVSISDHARIKPKIITMDCVVSDTPVGGLAERRGMIIDGAFTPGSAPSVDISPGGDFIASDVARAWLEALQLKRRVITVSTEWTRNDGSRGYKAYDNMMIQSIGETINADTGDTFTFKVTLKQIHFVTNDRTTVKVAVPRAKKKLDKGNKACKDVKKTPEQIKGSALQVLAHHVVGDGENYKIGTGAIGGLLGGGGH